MRFRENGSGENDYYRWPEQPVFSSTCITLENNEKIRPQPDRENAFARASGGGDGPDIQPSPSLKSRLQFRTYPEIPFYDNGLTEILPE
jgi:hypothetical protein